MPQLRSVSTCSRTFSSMLAMTRSGIRARMASRSGFFSPPMRVLLRTTSRGATQYAVTPTSASARPSAHSVSVIEGMSETMRRGGTPASRVNPDASVRGIAALTSRLVELQRRHRRPQRLAGRLEVLGVHEVQAVVQVHLELAPAEPAADPGFRPVEELRHLRGGQAHEPLEADGAGERLLHTDGGCDGRPDAGEFLEDLIAGGPRDTAIEQVAREIRLEQVPAPRRNHDAAECTMRPWPRARAGRTSRSRGASTRWRACWR